jgi:hypothetical protein
VGEPQYRLWTSSVAQWQPRGDQRRLECGVAEGSVCVGEAFDGKAVVAAMAWWAVRAARRAGGKDGAAYYRLASRRAMTGFQASGTTRSDRDCGKSDKTTKRRRYPSLGRKVVLEMQGAEDGQQRGGKSLSRAGHE